MIHLRVGHLGHTFSKWKINFWEVQLRGHTLGVTQMLQVKFYFLWLQTPSAHGWVWISPYGSQTTAPTPNHFPHFSLCITPQRDALWSKRQLPQCISAWRASHPPLCGFLTRDVLCTLQSWVTLTHLRAHTLIRMKIGVNVACAKKQSTCPDQPECNI